MSVVVTVPRSLRHECQDALSLTFADGTVQDILNALEARYPRLHRRVCDETGKVRQHINIFVNDDFMNQRDGLRTRLADGDTLTIMTAVSGG